MTDEIVEEVHAVRKKIWEQCGCDFKKLVEQLICTFWKLLQVRRPTP